MKKFDLHLHSTCSKHKIWGVDGVNTPQKIVKVAIRCKLDGIAITDHNTIRGSRKAIKYVREEKMPLFVIPGIEIRTQAGDIIALGIYKDIKPKLSVQETLDAIKSQSGIAIAAHPFKYNTKIATKLKDPSISSRFDAIEAFNADTGRIANYKAMQLTKKLRLPGIASSDAHFILNIGYGATYLNIDNLSLDDALNAIKKNRIKLQCKYPPFYNRIDLYSRKIANMLKRSFGKGDKSC